MSVIGKASSGELLAAIAGVTMPDETLESVVGVV
jgi:hypothetical protein